MDRIGSWRFDAEAGTLHHGALVKPLEDRSARVLEVLFRRRGEIVSKEELLREVWNGRSVSSNSVAIVIGDLRRALGDDPADPVHIVTVGKRGYRLIEFDGARAPGPRRGWLVTATVVAALAIGGAATILSIAPAPAAIELSVSAVRNDTGQSGYEPLAQSLTAVITDHAARLGGVHATSHPVPVPSRGREVRLQARLILWNGAPEVAITAIEPRSGSIMWSAFATGKSGNLARDTAAKLDELQRKLARIPDRAFFTDS